MGKLKIGSCPRCNKGEVFIDRDQYGWYECCLQCGYTRDLPNIAPPVANEWKSREKEGLPVKRTGRLL
jgi:hypothetical protein